MLRGQRAFTGDRGGSDARDSERRPAGVERNQREDFAPAGQDRAALFGEETGATVSLGT